MTPGYQTLCLLLHGWQLDEHHLGFILRELVQFLENHEGLTRETLDFERLEKQFQVHLESRVVEKHTLTRQEFDEICQIEKWRTRITKRYSITAATNYQSILESDKQTEERLILHVEQILKLQSRKRQTKRTLKKIDQIQAKIDSLQMWKNNTERTLIFENLPSWSSKRVILAALELFRISSFQEFIRNCL